MLKRMVLSLIAGLLIAGCNNDNASLSGREGGVAPDDGRKDQKPQPVFVEGIRPLLLQKPTLTEDKFLNSMQLQFGEADQALFTFTFDSTRAGSLFFTNIQSRLHLENCTKDKARPVKINVVWQEVQAAGRKPLKGFTPDITEYAYEPAKKYMLTYALLDLKGELSDCRSATLKFAAFDKNYSKSTELTESASE